MRDLRHCYVTEDSKGVRDAQEGHRASVTDYIYTKRGAKLGRSEGEDEAEDDGKGKIKNEKVGEGKGKS